MTFCIVRNFQLSEDSTQDTFGVCYGHLLDLLDDTTLPGFLSGIVRDLCRRALRAQRLDTVAPSGVPPSEDSETGSLPDFFSNREMHLCALKADRELPRRLRETVIFSYPPV